MSYMNDRKSSKQPIDHVKKHLKLTFPAEQPLKDEAYVQVLKQIKDHKDPLKAIKGWKFLAILASCYAPSDNLFYSLLNYLLFEIKTNKDLEIIQHANYIFMHLYKSFTNKRKQIPTENEIVHIEHMKPMQIPIYFF